MRILPTHLTELLVGSKITGVRRRFDENGKPYVALYFEGGDEYHLHAVDNASFEAILINLLEKSKPITSIDWSMYFQGFALRMYHDSYLLVEVRGVDETTEWPIYLIKKEQS